MTKFTIREDLCESIRVGLYCKTIDRPIGNRASLTCILIGSVHGTLYTEKTLFSLKRPIIVTFRSRIRLVK